MYVCSTMWRGSLNIANIRTLPSVEDCLAYLNTIPHAKLQGKIEPRFCRIYQVFPDKSPILINRPLTNNR
jgi:hypothetical protein